MEEKIKNDLFAFKKCNRVLEIMKISLLMFVLSAFCLMADNLYPQQAEISLNLNNVTLEKAISEIEKSSDYVFLVTDDAKSELDNRVSIHVDNNSIRDILEIIFSETYLAYNITERQVAVYKGANYRSKESIEPAAPEDVKQHKKEVRGTVIDEHEVPIIGANIMEKGTTNGIVTDHEGYFALSVEEDATLQVSYIGYISREISITDQTTLTVVLVEDNQALEELVVVGYGTQKKGNLTSAISTIKNEEILTTTHTSLAGRLQGKIPGLQIRQNSGQPGSFDATINIRGFGSPLYVIDGIQSNRNEFQRLTADDIENISILKDGSAAIYGLNAGNGVVLVTTKRGGPQKNQFRYSGTVTFSSPTDIPELTDAYQWLLLRNDAAVNVGMDPIYTKAELDNWRTGAVGYESTDWYNETMKKQAMAQNHVFSAEGGNERVNYYASLGYMQDQGLLKSNDMNYEQYTGRVNLTAQITKRITANVDLSGIYYATDYPAWDFFDIMRGTVSLQPTNQPYANSNLDHPAYVFDGQAWNSVITSNSDLTGYSKHVNKSFRTIASLTYEVPFIEGLQLKGVAAYESANSVSKGLNKSFKMYTYDETNDSYIPFVYGFPTRLHNSWADNTNLLLQTHLNYQKTLADSHNLGITAVYEQRQYWYQNAGLSREFQYYTMDQMNFGDTDNQKNNGSENREGYRSLVGRVTYDYMGKYMVEFASRYDGSYRYHPDKRWGFFPVISGGWRVSEEDFFSPYNEIVSNLKLRASYGVVGENAGSAFQYVGGFSLNQGGYEFASGTRTVGVAAPGVVNENLTWYESNIKNIGIDVGLLNNTLSFEFDLYQRDRSGLLGTRFATLPNTFGATMPQENLNKDRVRGIELSLGYVKQLTKELRVHANANFNFARRMTVYAERGPFTNSMDRWRNGQNERWGDVVWMYDYLGQFQSREEILYAPIQNGTLGNSRELPGDFRYRDVNNDRVIDDNDVLPLAWGGDPKMYYGLTMGATYKNFDFNMLWQGAAKYTLRFTHVYATYLWNDANMPAYFMDRWHLSDPYNPESEWVPGEWPAIRRQPDMGAMYNESSVWRRDASYVRLKSLEIGYTIPSQLLKRMGTQGLRVFVNGYNLLTICDPFIKAFDPERSEGRDNAGWSYPLSKSFNFGVNMSF